MGLHGLFWPSASANRGLFLRSGEDFRYNWDLKVSGREWGNRHYKEYCEECCHSSRAQIEALQYHCCEEEQPATRYTTWMNAFSTWVTAILICFCNTKEELSGIMVPGIMNRGIMVPGWSYPSTSWPWEIRTLLVFLLFHTSTRRFLTAWDSINYATASLFSLF